MTEEIKIVLSDDAVEKLDTYVRRNLGSSRDSIIEALIMSAERAELFLRLFTGKGFVDGK